MRGGLLAAIFLSFLCVTGAATAQDETSSSVPPAPNNGKKKCDPAYYPAQRLPKDIKDTIFTITISETGEPTKVVVDQSSGSSDLDDAATKCVLSAWHFTPATKDGSPTTSTRQYKIVWRGR